MSVNKKSIILNDLTRYSAWPEIIINSVKIKNKTRTNSDNNREYNEDKWGPLHKIILKNKLKNIKDVDKMYYGDESAVSMISQDTFIGKCYDARQIYNELVYEYLDELDEIDFLIELGAGYGSVILGYKQHKERRHKIKKWGAYEYTAAGQCCMRELSSSTDLTVGYCDLSSDINYDSIPENSVIFTSGATMCIPELKKNFFMALLKRNPKLVVHFEPIPNFFEDSLLGLMQKRYLELNDYNQNLYSVLSSMKDENLVEINDERKFFFAENIFAPFSLLSWSKKQ
jgi:hypothetical protein